MADSNPDTISLLRASLARWDQYLREIKEPDAVFQEQRNKISDRSKKRLEEFALNPPNDNISILQQALLSDAREIEKLELEHAATIARKQELQGETAEVVAGRILGDLIDILGLPVIQRLAPALLPPQEEQGATSKLVAGSDGLSAPDRPVAVVEEGPTPSNRYNTRSRRRLCQRTPAASNTPAAESEGAVSDQAVVFFFFFSISSHFILFYYMYIYIIISLVLFHSTLLFFPISSTIFNPCQRNFTNDSSAKEKEGHRCGHGQRQREKINEDDTETVKHKAADTKTSAALQRSNLRQRRLTIAALCHPQ